jgi:two-component system, cell cycle response regulator DivK
MTPIRKATHQRGDDRERGLTGHAPRPQRSRGPTARAHILVLIVDDSLDARELYATYLDHVGYSVRAVADGHAAIAAAVELRPDVVVMDLTMPHLDGITATQRIRNHPRTRNTPVILLTGYPQKAIERGALEAGADLFLTKPCLPEDLERYIVQLTERERPA